MASSLLARKHLGHAIIRYPALSLGTKSGHEAQRRRIHAVAKVRGLGAVVEDVA